MKDSLVLTGLLKFKKMLIAANLFLVLSFVNTANANLIDLVGDGWDGPGLGAFDVKYYFGDMTTDNGLQASSIHNAFLVAFNAWSDATNNNLTFTQTFTANQQDSIDISFEDRDHGDGFPFSTSTLAHAFFPDDVTFGTIAGDLHMNDESFSWEIGDSLGSPAFDIISVAVHEIGHSIGIGHTKQGNSGFIMDPGISSRQTFSGLTSEDVKAVCSLYLCTPTTTQVPEPSSVALILMGLFGTFFSRNKLQK